LAFALSLLAFVGSGWAQTFTWPVDTPTVSQVYGCKKCLSGSGLSDRYTQGIDVHTGIDLQGARGTSVYGAAEGTVERVFRTSDTSQRCDGSSFTSVSSANRGLGNAVIVRHPNGKFTLYGHMDCVDAGIDPGMPVTISPTRTRLGRMGNSADALRVNDTGANAFGVHLHFEVKDNGVLGDRSDTPGDGYVGYTPGHPDLYGYRDPVQIVQGTNVEAILPQAVRNPPPLKLHVRNAPGQTYLSPTQTAIVDDIDGGQEYVAFKRAFVEGGYWFFLHLPSANAPLEGAVAQNNGPNGGWVAAAEVVTDSSATQVAALSDGVRIRTMPTTGAADNIVAKAYNGQRLVTTETATAGNGCSSQWYHVYLLNRAAASSGWACGDNLMLAAAPASVTPTPTPTNTPTGTRTRTATNTPTLTLPVPSITPTRTPTVTSTGTRTATPTQSLSPSTPTATPTRTPTITPTTPGSSPITTTATTTPTVPPNAVLVPGDQRAGTNTGVFVNQGDLITITASGTILYDLPSRTKTFGPDGNGQPGVDCVDEVLLEGISSGSLIGAVGVPPAQGSPALLWSGGTGVQGPGFVGSSFSGTAPASGFIFLAMNDCNFADNEGAYVAVISVGVNGPAFTPSPTPTTPAPTPNGCAGHPGAVFCDNFDDNTLDSSRWVRRIIGAGDIDIQETNGRLEASLGPNVTPFTDTGFGAFYESRCQLRGDFDIEVGFDLLQWSANSGVRVGFVLSHPDTPDDGIGGRGSVGLSRSAIGSGEYFIFFDPDPQGAFTSVPATDSSGRLRLVRNRDIVTGYYLSGGSWIALGPGSSAPADRLKVRFGIRSISADFAHQVTRVALDDFVVNQGTVVCPEAPTTCSQVLFEDNFDGSTLDSSKWNVVTNGYPEPAYSVADGFIYVGRNIPSAMFPAIFTAANPFPTTGDFSVEVAMQYSQVAGLGDGFWLSGPNGEILLRIWQDTLSGGVNVSLNDRGPYVVNPNLSLHRYRFDLVRNIATAYVDDSAILSQPIAVRPNTLAFGNGAAGLPSAFWTLFRIDSIRVGSGCTSPPVWVDDFNDNQIDPARWQPGSWGTGPILDAVGGHIEITIPASSSGADAGGLGGFGTNLYPPSCTVDGDFDVQVDYDLLEWPLNSGVRIWLKAGSLLTTSIADYPGVERASSGLKDYDRAALFRDHYATWSDSSWTTGFVPSAERAGTLRLVRIGATLTGYVSKPDGWSPVGSFASVTGPLPVFFGAGSFKDPNGFGFTSQRVRIAFDNFVISRGLLDCGSRPTPAPAVSCSDPGTSPPSTSICSNTIWSRAQSPIKIGQTIALGGGCPPGAAPTLTIEPGVKVCFMPNAALNVASGTLFARGTASSPIVFTSSQLSPAPGDWDGIRFANGTVDATFDTNGHFTGGSILEHVRVQYAKDSDGKGAVSATQALPFLNEVNIRRNAVANAVVGLDVQDKNRTIRLRAVRVESNSARGSNGVGIRLRANTVADIRDAQVLINPGDGIYAESGSTLVLRDSSVTRHQVGTGIRCAGRCDLSYVNSSFNPEGLTSSSGNGSIGGSTLLFNWVFGLNLGSSGSSWTVERNIIAGNGTGGIQVSGSTAVIRTNCIADNGKDRPTNTNGRAIRLAGQATIEKNTIVGNYGSAVWVSGPQSKAITQNNLEGNAAPILEYGASSSAATLQATNNWWGGTSSAEVGVLVYDQNDNPSPARAYVNFDQPAVASGPIPSAPTTGPCARCIDDVPTDHWRGEYWNNMGYTSAPRMIRDDGAMLRADATGLLDINFGTDKLGSPSLACGIGTDVISAQWAGTANFAQSGTYRFSCTMDDACNIFIDGAAVLAQSIDPPLYQVKTSTVDRSLTAGPHEVRVQFVDYSGPAVLKVSWQFTGPMATTTYTATSTVTLTPRPSPTFTPTPTFTKTGAATPTRTSTLTGTRPTAAFTPTPAPSPTGGICSQPKIDLAILIDSSGSIDPGDFEVEKEGFARAIDDPSKVPQDGSVCVTVIEFSSSPTLYVPLSAGCIADAAAATRIANEIQGISYTGGATGIDSAITSAAAEFASSARPDARQTVLLATDGILNACDTGVRPLPLCPPPPPCAGFDTALSGARAAGVDEVDVIAIEDPGEGSLRPALIRDDFTNFYGCRVFPQPNSPGPPPQPGFVITVGRDFTEFARVVTSTLPSLSCATRIDLNDTTGQPSGTSRINATLTKAPGVQVSLAGSDITFDPTILQADCSTCNINPAIGPGTAANKSLRCARTDIDSNTARLRVDVFATDNTNPLPDGRLFTCEVKPVSTLARGTIIPLRNQPSAVAPDSTLIATLGRDGSITVSGCPGDCDGNGEVGLDEVGRAVLLFLGIPPSSPCPAADANGDGQVRIGEVVQVIAARYQGCGR
jgi:murein DD-endopeptidase MepM/ murein hydrolase activator NlpD